MEQCANIPAHGSQNRIGGSPDAFFLRIAKNRLGTRLLGSRCMRMAYSMTVRLLILFIAAAVEVYGTNGNGTDTDGLPQYIQCMYCSLFHVRCSSGMDDWLTIALDVAIRLLVQSAFAFCRMIQLELKQNCNTQKSWHNQLLPIIYACTHESKIATALCAVYNNTYKQK